MEDINGEKVVTNKNTGDKLVLRGGQWVPYVPPQTGFQKYFARPATNVAGKVLSEFDPRTFAHPLNPATPDWAKSVAKAVVPQTPTQAAIDAAMLGTLPFGGEGILPALGRTAAVATSGALGSKAEGRPALEGAKTGAWQQGMGEIAAPVINFAGRFGKGIVNQKDVQRIGGALKNLIPSLGDLKSVVKFDSAFRGGEAVEKIGKRLGQFEQAISNRLGGKPLGSMPLKTAMKLTGQTQPLTVQGPATFDDMIARIRELNRVGYSYAGDAQQKALAADARRQAHDMIEDLGKALNKQSPGLGDRFLKVRRQYAGTSLLTRIFSDPDLYDASGRLDMSVLQSLVANRGSAGFREDLVRVFGRGKANELLNKVYRGAPPTARDIEGGLNAGVSMHPGPAGISPRVFMHPHLPQHVGAVPRRFPKIPPATPGLALGQMISDYLNRGQQ